MFATTMLWFTPKCFVPNSSVVAETAIVVTAPVHAPITAVPTYKKDGRRARSMKKAPDIGAINAAINADLDAA